MKVIVTGGCGFIGSHVVELLIKEGYEVIVIDNFITGKRTFLPPQVKVFDMDITSPLIETIFSKEKPDYVVHLAAQTDVTKSISEPVDDANSNILGTINILNYCHKYNVKKIVFSSSCAVYGETQETTIVETAPLMPVSFYGISKYTSEMYIQLYHSLFGLPFSILRYANVYGPRQASSGEGGVVAIFMNKLLNGESPYIYGNGEQTRDFVYVKDVASANVLCLTRGKNEIYNISSNNQTSINRLYEIISTLNHTNVPPSYQPKRKGDIENSKLDNSKAFKFIGWKPQYDLYTGLLETMEYYKGIQ